MVRSSSSSSFTSLEQSRQRQRQDTARSQVKMGINGDLDEEGNPDKNFSSSQVDLSPESRGKPALKRTTGDFHSFCQIIHCSVSYSMCIVNQINHSINSIVGGGAGAGAGGGGAKPKGKPNDQVLTSHLYQVAMMVAMMVVVVLVLILQL